MHTSTRELNAGQETDSMSGKLLLNSWKEIAEFVGRTERTVQRWEKRTVFRCIARQGENVLP